jgi:biotin carboxylase
MMTPTILCIATYFKGDAFLRECRGQGATVLLLTSDTLANAEWPRDAIDEIHTIRRGAGDADVLRVVAGIARRRAIDRVAALDDFDVELCGTIREFLQVDGFGRTVASRFRDKLAMRRIARRLGLPVPEFTGVFTDAAVDGWAAAVAPPWVLKPRSSAASTGIRKIARHEDLWPALNAAGDDRPLCLLEQFVAGDVYHVDSIVRNGAIVFAVASKYGQPPMQIAHDGGVFVTRRLRDDSPDAAALLRANHTLLTGFELRNGVSHTEFIMSADGVTFLETSARVGGAYIADVVEAATGINLWREWARVELAGDEGAYDLPRAGSDAAGIALCLARQEQPDLSGYSDPEIIKRVPKKHHAGLIVRSPDFGRIEALLGDYAARFSRDFLATMPAPERPVE